MSAHLHVNCWARHQRKRAEQQLFNEHAINQPAGDYEYHVQWRSGRHDSWIEARDIASTARVQLPQLTGELHTNKG